LYEKVYDEFLRVESDAQDKFDRQTLLEEDYVEGKCRDTDMPYCFGALKVFMNEVE